MFNALGIYSSHSTLLPIMGRRVTYTQLRSPNRLLATPGIQLGGNGNDVINIGGGEVGPPGPLGPPGPPGTPSLVPVTIVTDTPFTVTLTDYLLDINVAAPSSVILPISPTGTVFVVKDISGSASTNVIIVTGLGAAVDGNATATINTDYGSITLIFNGTEWNII
jgi:hypothetical protein